MNTLIRPKTVKIISKLIQPFVDEGVIGVSEERELITTLKHLATKGAMPPQIKPRLIDRKELCELMGLSLSNLKKLEREDKLPFKRRAIGGTTIRYYLPEVIQAIEGMDEDDSDVGDDEE